MLLNNTVTPPSLQRGALIGDLLLLAEKTQQNLPAILKVAPWK